MWSPICDVVELEREDNVKRSTLINIKLWEDGDIEIKQNAGGQSIWLIGPKSVEFVIETLQTFLPKVKESYKE